MEMKLCPRCKEYKPVSGFSKNKRLNDGLNWDCKMCESAYYKANRQRYLENSRLYHESHKDNEKKRVKRYYEKTIERRRMYSKKHKKTNRDHYSAMSAFAKIGLKRSDVPDNLLENATKLVALKRRLRKLKEAK